MPLTEGQSEAVGARGNVIVVAGAGTGKTSTLVERCLDLVREGVSLDRVLMVTFTDAAAAEMRHRLRSRLQQMVEETPNPPQLETYSEQLALVETARISTLHGFCLRLVRTHFHELGIDPEVDVLDARRCRGLADETLEGLMQDGYAGRLSMSDAVRELVATYAPDRDSLVRGWVLQLHHYSQTLPDAADWIRRQEVVWASDSPKQWEDWLKIGFLQWRRLWLPMLRAGAGVKNIDQCLGALSALPRSPSLSAIRDVVTTILAADHADWDGLKGKVRKPLSLFFEEAAFMASVAEAGALKADWQAVRWPMRALLGLAAEFTARFSRAKRELGGVDFADLEQLALRLLLEPGGQPSSAARALQARIDHVFVDECQDINAAQDAIVRAVSRNGHAANRFLVGDVKQSIYQFRLADPRIFKRYEEQWAGGGVGQRIPLTENFRSRPGVLEFVNALFSRLMRESFGGVSYEPFQAAGGSHMSDGRDGPCVELHFIRKPANDDLLSKDTLGELADLSSVEREARLLAHRLRALKESGFTVWDMEAECQRAVEWRDMAVLLRSPSPRVEAYAKEFHRAGIPLAAARAGFLEATEISDLISLLKVLDNPLQDVPLLAALHSPLVAFSLEDLATIRMDGERKPFWRALREFEADASPAHAPLRARVKGFLDQFRRWRESVRQVGPSICLEQILADTSYDLLLGANERGVEQAANVRRLLEEARQFDPYQRQGLYRFLRYIESLQDAGESIEPAPVPVRDAVQLMSIHRSKGLEFPVVALAGLGSRFNLRDLHSVILLDQEYGLAPKATTSSGAARYPTLPFWLAERRQRAQQLGEELRLLYVAATRARERLLLTGTLPAKEAGRWESRPDSTVSDRELLRAVSPMDWLTAWLPAVTLDSDWMDDDHGASDTMTWELWDPQDPRLATPSGTANTMETPAKVGVADPSSVDRVVQRLSWQYAHAAASKEPAKSSVTALRSRAGELAEEETVERFPRTVFRSRTRGRDEMSAARVGTLHHRLLQHIRLEHAADLRAVGIQVKALVEQGLFTSADADVLELDKVVAFWSSEVGRSIRMESGRVKRELPFTLRFENADLRSLLGQGVEPTLAGEFVVVQGVVDLAVILDHEIWLLDFKTDQIGGGELRLRTEYYRPQLQLYATALERIYQRPVRRRWLHYLAAGETVELV